MTAGPAPSLGTWRRPTTFKVLRVASALYLVVIFVLTLATVAQCLVPGTNVPVTIPLKPFWPELPDGVEVVRDSPVEVVGGGMISADVTLANLGWDVRVLLALAHLVQGALAVMAGLVGFRMGGLFRYPGQTVFVPALSRMVRRLGGAFIVVGIGFQILMTVAGSVASEQALRIKGWNGPPESMTPEAASPGGPLDIEPALAGTTVEFWPIVVGIALLGLGAILRHGETLEPDKTNAPIAGTLR